MTQAWVTLTGRDGRTIAAPSEEQLDTELDAVFEEADGNDTATASLRFGYDDGLMYVAEISSDGTLRFEEWSDSDCELALAAPRTMLAGYDEALVLWDLMARRQVSRIRALPWQA
ncbi:MAG: hypothetical protein V4723_03635 [Pseudomonadota bacterium]